MVMRVLGRTGFFLEFSCKRCASFFTAEQVLSDVNVRNTVEKLKNLPSIRMKTVSPIQKAAVLIPLCMVDGKVSLLYTLRASNLRSHRGQVSFPGGKQDEGESLEDTALRETKEELGIDYQDIKVWGSGNIISARNAYILPVVGEIQTKIDVNHPDINREEVEEVFTVTIEDLCDPTKTAHTQFKNQISLPVFLGGKRRIWGITAMITHVFLRSFLPPGAYKNSIKYIPSISRDAIRK